MNCKENNAKLHLAEALNIWIKGTNSTTTCPFHNMMDSIMSKIAQYASFILTEEWKFIESSKANCLPMLVFIAMQIKQNQNVKRHPKLVLLLQQCFVQNKPNILQCQLKFVTKVSPPKKKTLQPFFSYRNITSRSNRLFLELTGSKWYRQVNNSFYQKERGYKQMVVGALSAVNALIFHTLRDPDMVQ